MPGLKKNKKQNFNRFRFRPRVWQKNFRGGGNGKREPKNSKKMPKNSTV